jgi:hypothetical protein
VSAYFRRYQPHIQPYGFLPERPELLNVREEIEAEHKPGGASAAPTVDANQPAIDPDTKRVRTHTCQQKVAFETSVPPCMEAA